MSAGPGNCPKTVVAETKLLDKRLVTNLARGCGSKHGDRARGLRRLPRITDLVIAHDDVRYARANASRRIIELNGRRIIGNDAACCGPAG